MEFQLPNGSTANILSQTNHLQIITNLYAKGVRTLILPNAVDLSKIPAFNAGTFGDQPFTPGAWTTTSNFPTPSAQARILCPGLKIYVPDFFTLLNNVISNAASYGLTNALSAKGYSIDAYDDPNIVNLTLNGQGTNYIFWDKHDPTAKFHEVIADVAQQVISPVQISGIAMLNDSNRLDVANYPAGLNGSVDACTNLAQTIWTVTVNVAGTNTTQSVFVPAAGPQQFYRLHFPYAWSWP